MRIAIIGAGFTGLSAAYEFVKSGHHVELFERNSDIGGLAGGFSLADTSLEKAYHHLFRTDTAILSLAKELNVNISWHESRVCMVLRSKQGQTTMVPFNGVKDVLQFPAIPFIDRLRGGIATFFLQHFTSWKTLTKTTALDWMNKWAGKNFTDAIWRPLLKGKFDRFYEHVSMAWLWGRIHVRANSRASIFAKELLAYPDGGFIKIAQALVEKTSTLQQRKQSDWLHLNTTIESVTYKNELIYVSINGKPNEFDKILFTTPSNVVEKLTNTVIEQKKTEYLHAVILAFSSSQSLSRYYWHNITEHNAPFLVFLQHTNLIPPAVYQDKHVYYIGAYLPQDHELLTFSDSDIKKKWFTYLTTIFPQFDENRVETATLFRLPFAQHVVDINYEDKILPHHVSQLPNTFIANFAQIFPQDRGTNYSVEEGQQIAKRMIQ